MPLIFHVENCETERTHNTKTVLWKAQIANWIEEMQRFKENTK